jgi:hypothetical protein
MRLFRIGNKGTMSSWVFADNEDEACDIFFRNSSTRKRENVRVCHECQPSDFPKTDIGQVNVKGIGAVMSQGGIRNGTDLMDMLRTGVRPPEATQTWIVCDNGERLKG